MVNLAFSLEDLGSSQELRRRGHREAFWDHKRLRRSARVAMGEVESRSRITFILDQVRDFINSGGLAAERELRAADDDPMAARLPLVDKLRSIGAAACESSNSPDLL